MIYIGMIVAVITLIFFKIGNDKQKFERQLNAYLEENWGKVPTQEYSYEKLASIPRYYEANKDVSLDVDDITWNDLDMDRIFMLLNHTESSIGEEYLYCLLRKLQYTKSNLEERNRLITFFSEHPKERTLVQKKLRMMGKLKDISFYEYINRVDALKPHKPYMDYLCLFLLPASIATLFIPAIGSYAFGIITAVLVFNIALYYKRKAQISVFFNVFSYILRMLAYMEELSKIRIEGIDDYLKELSSEVSKFKSFRRGAFLAVSKKSSGSLEDVILDYLRLLTHFDLIKFDHMADDLRSKKEDLNYLFKSIGLLDSAIAIASFRELMNQEFCLPEFSKTFCRLEAEQMYHPLIIDPVKNSIYAKTSILLTGSNASGKSTFIKTVAINAILAQTIYTALCTCFKSCFFKVYSSMALRDDIISQESYYIVEIKSLKRIYDESGTEIPILCFIDEVLRGTNTAERIAASSQILKALCTRNALVFAATHDVELTYILDKYYGNYHFEEQVEENNVRFDYVLREGRATSRNAIKLLALMGYSREIIEQATDEVNHFLSTNQWNTI